MRRELVCGLGWLVLVAGSGRAQSLPLQGLLDVELVAPDATHISDFGTAVALSADRAVVGDSFPNSPTGSLTGGEVYVFARSGTDWIDEATLIAPDGEESDRFGGSLDLSGETILVGASSDDVGSTLEAGSASVFVRDGSTGEWYREAWLTADDAGPFDRFGYSVAIDGDLAVVGAPFDAVASMPYRGSAYVFARTGATWTQEAKLIAPDGAADDNFGLAVVVQGDSIVVGAPGAAVSDVQDAGKAYVFKRIGSVWHLQGKLGALIPEQGARFGSSLALEGETLVGGSPGAGSAEVFAHEGAGWTHQAHLSPSDPGSGESFGHAVTISGDMLVVTADTDSVGPVGGAGSAYVFTRTASTWSEALKLVAPSAAASEYFGTSADLVGTTVIVGLPGGSLGLADSGTADVFTLVSEGVWTDLGMSLPAGSVAPTLTPFGTILPGSPILLLLKQAKPLSPAALLIGLSAPQLPFKGGTLVPSPDLIVAAPTLAPGNGVLQANWPAGLPSGLVLYMQWWIVDSDGPAGFTASNALSATNP